MILYQRTPRLPLCRMKIRPQSTMNRVDIFLDEPQVQGVEKWKKILKALLQGMLLMSHRYLSTMLRPSSCS